MVMGTSLVRPATDFVNRASFGGAVDHEKGNARAGWARSIDSAAVAGSSAYNVRAYLQLRAIGAKRPVRARELSRLPQRTTERHR